MTRARLWCFRIVTVMLSVISALALVEGLSAILYHYEKQANEAIVHPASLETETAFHRQSIPIRADPYLQYRIEPNQQLSRTVTNQYGLRNREISPTPSPGTLRILLLGGSVAWGFQALSNDDTISAYLEGILNDRSTGFRFEVLNGAAPGYVSWQGSLIYALHYRQLGAHLIITLDGANEIGAGLTASRPGYPLGFDEEMVSTRRPRLSLAGVVTDWLGWRLSRTKFYKLLYEDAIPRLAFTKSLRSFRPRSVEEIQPPSPDSIAATYANSLQHLVDVASFEQRMVLAVLQPSLILPESKLRTEFEETMSLEFEAKSPGVTQYTIAAYRHLRRALNGLKSGNANLHIVDASLLFSAETGNIFTDNCHLTTTGRKILALTLADQVLDLPLQELLAQ